MSQPNVVVSALQSAKDGAMVLRVYDATGKPAHQVKLTFAAPVAAASETNLMQDPGAELKADGSTLMLDLSAFQIRNLLLRLARPSAQAVRS